MHNNALPFKTIASFDFDLHNWVLLEQKNLQVRDKEKYLFYSLTYLLESVFDLQLGESLKIWPLNYI